MPKCFKKCTSKSGEWIVKIGRHLIFIILFFAACTSSSHNGGVSDSTSYVDDIPKEAAPQREPETHIVEIKQMKFVPDEVTVRRGDRVQWINKDITDHDVTEQATHAWASSPLKTGQSWTLTVTESADYFCNLHQVMKGKITVEESAAY